MQGPVTSLRINKSPRNGASTVTHRVIAEVPVTLRLPLARQPAVLDSGSPIATSKGILSVQQVRPRVSVELGSGKCCFSYPSNMRTA